MKAFRFSLDVVLGKRKRDEELAQKDLALVVQQIHQIRTNIETQKKFIDSQQTISSFNKNQTIDLDTIISSRRFVETLRSELTQWHQKLALLAEEFSKKQQKLIEASQKKQALVKLRDSQYDSWKRENFRQEQLEMDEIAANIRRPKVNKETQ